MKLSYKRTILVGFAFFLICAFWQAYDNTVPLILTNKFGMSQTWSGVIMAMDNVLALFLLPLFGHISDKCTHPKGRRTPFIVVGTLVAAIALIALSFADNAQLKRLDKVSAIDDPAALETYRLEGVYLGRAIAAACNLLNPSKVIIGGGISLAFDLFEASLWDTLRQYIYWNANQQLTIQPTALGYNGGLLGAAAVAVCGLENRHGWGMVESRKPGQ